MPLLHFRYVTITSTWELRKLTHHLNKYLYREMSSSVELAQGFLRKILKCEEVRRSGQLAGRTLTLGLFFKIIPYFLQLVAILYVYVKRYTSVHYSTGGGGGGVVFFFFYRVLKKIFLLFLPPPPRFRNYMHM